MSFNAKVFLHGFLNLKIKNLTQTPISPLLHLPCKGRLDLAVHLSSILGKEFEMVIQWILSFSFSSLTIRLFLCVLSRAPAVRAALQCLLWCLVLQQLPPYFLLLICFFCFFVFCSNPLMILRHRDMSLLCNLVQTRHTRFSHFLQSPVNSSPAGKCRSTSRPH